MPGEHDKELRRALEKVAPHGWKPVPSSGYKLKMHCACGIHQTWLPKTPSNPKKFREQADHMIRTCSVPDDQA